MARPRKQVDESLLLTLARLGCTNEEVASELGISADTLTRRFADTLKRGQMSRNVSLRRHMVMSAESGNTTMQIWLSKNWLGFKDRTEQLVEDGQLDQLMDAIRRS